MNAKIVAGALIILLVGIVLVAAQAQDNDTTPTFRQLHENTIINADLWSAEPQILSAGYGFDNIIGVNGGETEVRGAGGTWNTVSCDDPPRNVLTSSAESDNLNLLYDQTTTYSDGLPVVFSWPILPETLRHTDFAVTTNTGEVITPDSASIYPNFEYNERHVAVIFGDFGNRLRPGEEGARYSVRVEIVEDDDPLMLVGPEGAVSAVGMFWETDSTPYVSGPYLVGAKLNRFSDEGEGAPRFLSGNLPNDGAALYGDDAQYRLRIFTTGGFSPDGVQGVRPDQFARFFRIHATGEDGETVLLTETGVDYAVAGGTIQVVGLAELGLAASDGGRNPITYDECYVEDHDNYIDIILKGDEAAMRNIQFLEIPAEGDYLPFYNPGGPGNNPSPGIRYTAPGPADLEPVIIALDDPMTVTYEED